jgi:hypothetical protein
VLRWEKKNSQKRLCAAVGKVTLKSKAVEALSDEFCQKVTPRKCYMMTLKSIANKAFNAEKRGSNVAFNVLLPCFVASSNQY